VSWSAVVARHTPSPGDNPSLPDGVADALRTGKLEQTCRACGRCEAAGHYCSWCARPMGPDDWYCNGEAAERARRLPVAAPANPPSEYRRSYRPEYGDGWPPTWGPNPYGPPASRRSRVDTAPVAEPESGATPDPAAGFWPA
jgi:hypothetical protein